MVQLAKGLEKPSQCLLCERLFKLNLCSCNTALSGRSGKRIAETLKRREALCGWSAPRVRWHCGCSMAGVKGHCGSWHGMVEVHSCWVKSIWMGQRSPFLCVCWFCIVCLCACMCLYVYLCMCTCWPLRVAFVRRNPANAGLSHPWDQQFSPHLETDREWGEPCGHPHYAPIVPM